MNASELFVQCLEQEGVKYIFGVPGEENEAFLFALSKSNIEFVPTRHEQGAAFMANVWGRLSGKAGVCLSTLGPGATNLLTGVADAYLDYAPLVAITGQGSLDRQHQKSHQMIDVTQMLKPVTKWNGSILTPEIIPEIIRKSFKIAEQQKSGPTHIELPEDVAYSSVPASLGPLKKNYMTFPSPESSRIEKAVELIRHSNKPLILVGNGAIREKCSAEIKEFSKRLNIPVANTFMAKGVIVPQQKQYLGTVGLGFKDYINQAFEQADLVICMGYDLSEFDPINWNENNSKKIIHLDLHTAEIFSHYVPEVEIIGSIKQGVSKLLNLVQSKPKPDWFIDIQKRIHESIESYRFSDSERNFHVPGVLHAIRESLPTDGILISDVGSHKMWIARNYHTTIPNGCIISNGLASMGISLPGAIAAKLYDKNRGVVSIMGDGGALMNIQELETAKRLNISCVFIVLNDNNYGLIEWKQKMSSGKAFGTNLGNPNFKDLAKSFGLKGYIPENISDIKKIIKNTLTNNEIALIEIPINTEVNQELIEELDKYYKK